MKLVVVTQWVRTRVSVPPDERLASTPTETGLLPIEVSRARAGRYTPHVVSTRQRWRAGCAAKVLRLAARGVSTRELPEQRADLSDTEVSPMLLSTIPEARRAWPARSLAAGSPLLSCDALDVTSRQAGPGQTHTVSLACGGTLDGTKALVGRWRSERAGATCWGAVVTARHNRGVEEGFIAGVEGRTGLPDAMERVCPTAQVPRCLVHQVRHRLRDGPWQERRAVAADVRAISGAATLLEAAHALARFAERGDATSTALSPRGVLEGERLTGQCDSPPARRRALDTTQAIES